MCYYVVFSNVVLNVFLVDKIEIFVVYIDLDNSQVTITKKKRKKKKKEKGMKREQIPLNDCNTNSNEFRIKT